MRISDWSSDVCSSDLLAGRTLVRHLSFNAFWDELQVVPHLLLEVAVSRAAGHRAERAHAPVRLVGPALVQVDLAGALRCRPAASRSWRSRRRRRSPWRGRRNT